jgi:hypothetical protein
MSCEPPAIRFTPDRRVEVAAPHETSWAALKQRYGAGAHRAALAAALEDWIAAVRTAVLPQRLWIGGSFCSDKPEPGDVDVVLFYALYRYEPDPVARGRFLETHARLLAPQQIAAVWPVDAATIPLHAPPLDLIRLSARWSMILSNGPGGERRGFWSVDGPLLPRAWRRA